MAKKIENALNQKTYLFQPKLQLVEEQFKTINVKPEVDNKSYSILSKKREELLGEEHPFDYQLIENVLTKFGLVSAIIEKIADFTIGKGVYIESKNTKVTDLLDDWIKKTKLNKYLKPSYKEAIGKGSGYIEVAGFANSDLDNELKVVNANSMYARRDKSGNIIGYSQFVGQNTLRVSEDDIIKLKPEEILQFNVNKIGSCVYGYGIVYSALNTIEDFLLAQKSLHKLVKRKANSPIHAKLGNAEKDDYPSQSDIDGFGSKMTYMNETTEWVTGPNVEFKILDFGNIGDKFATILENDYQLLSYSFQVPEVLLGSDRGYSGSSEVQLDAFLRNCKSRQDDISIVLRTKIFDTLLERNGLGDEEYEIYFDTLTENEINKNLLTLKELLNSSASPGLKMAIERKLSYYLGIDYDEIEKLNDEFKQQVQQPQQDVDGNTTEPVTDDNKPVNITDEPSDDEEYENNKYSIPEYFEKLSTNLKGRYKKLQHYLLQQEKVNTDVTLQEWVRKDYSGYKQSIIERIKEDSFSDLRANNKVEERAGYLNDKKIEKLKQALIEGFEDNKSIKGIAENIKEKVGITNLYEYNKKGLVRNEDGKRILLLDKDERIKMIAQTETVRLSAEGAMKDMKDKGIQLVRWNTVLDEQTCPICNELNNAIFESIDYTASPPAHPSCRCTIEEIQVATENSNKVKTILENGVKNKLSPQEIESQIMQIMQISQNRVQKLVENYIKIKDKIVEK
jgi:SPP1 gp7 family putative phage head morphogenesis protein